MAIKVNDGSVFNNRSGGSVALPVRMFYWNGSAYVEDTDIIIFQGPSTQNPKVASGGRDQANDIWIDDAAVAPVVGQVIGRAYQHPTTPVTVGTTTTAFADIDATNLAVTFVVPASGAVRVILEAQAELTGGSSAMAWGVREGSTTLIYGRVLAFQGGLQVQMGFDITGLTAGTTKTYKFAHARMFGAATGQTRYGYDSVTIGNSMGPAVMTVQAL